MRGVSTVMFGRTPRSQSACRSWAARRLARGAGGCIDGAGATSSVARLGLLRFAGASVWRFKARQVPLVTQENHDYRTVAAIAFSLHAVSQRGVC